MSFGIYILRCSDGTYYTDHTDNLDHRIAQHQFGELPGYTHDRPVELMFCETFTDRIDALEREQQVKDWSCQKKEALIRGVGAAVSDAPVLDRGPRLHSTLARTERSWPTTNPYSGRTD